MRYYMYLREKISGRVEVEADSYGDAYRIVKNWITRGVVTRDQLKSNGLKPVGLEEITNEESNENTHEQGTTPGN